MKSPAVRPATAADAEAVAALARRPFAAAWSQDAYAAETSRPDAVFLVAVESGVVGYALARVTGDELQLLDFAAARDGRGVGRALWGALVDAGRARAARTLTLEVAANNARALAFYARAGARVVGRRAKFYNGDTDALLLDVQIE